MGTSRGVSKNQGPIFCRVFMSCQKRAASCSREKRRAISPKSTVLNCVSPILCAASDSAAAATRGSAASIPGWRRRQQRTKSTVESPS